MFCELHLSSHHAVLLLCAPPSLLKLSAHIINVLSQLSSTGELEVTVNMEKILSKHNGPKDLNSLVGKYLYITVLLHEDTGTHTRDLKMTVIRFRSVTHTPPHSSSLTLRWNHSGGGVCCREVCQITLQPESGVHAPLHQTWASL